ncbi:hypothetical protein U1Q18_037554, partial [Sarracenia purpurea var. burkii]
GLAKREEEEIREAHEEMNCRPSILRRRDRTSWGNLWNASPQSKHNRLLLLIGVSLRLSRGANQLVKEQ